MAYIEPTDGDDVIFGTEENDNISSGAGNDEIYALGGNDVVYSTSGDNYFEGGEGNDELVADEGNDTLVGGDGDDALFGGDGSNELHGGEGNDYLFRYTAVADFLDGGPGDDHIDLNDFGQDTVIGGEGWDRLSLAPMSDALPMTYRLDIAAGTFTTQEDPSVDLHISGIEEWQFGSFYSAMRGDLEIVGSDASELLIVTLVGTISIRAEDGDDRVEGRFSAGTVDLGDGNDSFRFTSLSGAHDNATIDGGAGDDLINVSLWDYSFGDGHLVIDAGIGNDTIITGDGIDEIAGGAGFDMLDMSSDPRLPGTRIDLEGTVEDVGRLADTIVTGVEAFVMTAVADQFRGDAMDNAVMGGGWSDRLYGRDGNDSLDGGTGADALYGNLGVDLMTGGGAEGQRDRFIYFNIVESGVGAGNRDVITDFEAGVDRIEIRRFDADVTLGFKQAFDFVGDAGLSGVAGELAYAHEGGNTIVMADVDGDGLADFEIELTGIMDLGVDDFLI